MGNINLEKLPKKFCENITIAFSEEYFLLAMLNGETIDVYALTPQHIKRLQEYISHQITEYEKKNGKIEGKEWAPGVKSPLQTIDKQKNKK